MDHFINSQNLEVQHVSIVQRIHQAGQGMANHLKREYLIQHVSLPSHNDFITTIQSHFHK